jgi:large subunit ribosomal protein L30
MTKVRITQVKSAIDRPLSQKSTLKALGIQRLNRPVEINTNEALNGMIEKVKHLLKVEVI